MVRIRQILCPTDFSELSAAALDHAVAHSRFYGARLTVLHVAPQMRSRRVTTALAINPILMEPGSHECLLAMVREFAEPAFRAGLDPTCVVRKGPIAAEILAEATHTHADIVALGTHGRSGCDRLLLGSVAEKVLRKAPCPVLTVASPAHRATFLGGKLRSIICPVDFSPISRLALTHALSTAAQSKARLTVLYVLEWPPGRPAKSHAITPAEYREQLQSEALHELEVMVPEDARSRGDVHLRVALGSPWRQILHTLTEEHADLAVLGVQGATRAEQVVFGSVVNKVVRHATCPVLTVRQLDQER